MLNCVAYAQMCTYSQMPQGVLRFFVHPLIPFHEHAPEQADQYVSQC